MHWGEGTSIHCQLGAGLGEGHCGRSLGFPWCRQERGQGWGRRWISLECWGRSWGWGADCRALSSSRRCLPSLLPPLKNEPHPLLHSSWSRLLLRILNIPSYFEAANPSSSGFAVSSFVFVPRIQGLCCWLPGDGRDAGVGVGVGVGTAACSRE